MRSATKLRTGPRPGWQSVCSLLSSKFKDEYWYPTFSSGVLVSRRSSRSSPRIVFRNGGFDNGPQAAGPSARPYFAAAGASAFCSVLWAFLPFFLLFLVVLVSALASGALASALGASAGLAGGVASAATAANETAAKTAAIRVVNSLLMFASSIVVKFTTTG